MAAEFTVADRGLEIERDGDVKTLWLSRSEKLNALDQALVEALIEAVAVSATDGTRLLVFCGQGKGFSGGFDFSDVDRQSDGDLALRFLRIEQLLQAVAHAPFMTLGLVHGPCYGAAADLVASCARRIAAADARFRMPGLRFGVVLGTRRLARLIGQAAARGLLSTSRVFDAAEARRLGFVDEVVPADQWRDVVAATAAEARQLTVASAEALLRVTAGDTRDADLAELARAVAAPGLKARIASYLESLNVSYGAPGRT